MQPLSSLGLTHTRFGHVGVDSLKFMSTAIEIIKQGESGCPKVQRARLRVLAIRQWGVPEEKGQTVLMGERHLSTVFQLSP